MIKNIGDNNRIYDLIMVKIAKKSLMLNYGLSNTIYEKPTHAFALKAFKVVGDPILGIEKLPIWESWEKHHLGVTFVVNHKEYYKGKGGGFPQI
jgi:hypothetical protein